MQLLRSLSYIVISFIVVSFIMTGCFSTSEPESKSITMNSMVIEEKGYEIEPGEYMEMWVIGYDQDEEEKYREQYKVMIQDDNIYNLLKEGETYFVRLSGSRNDSEENFLYTISQIARPDGDQLRGEGKISH